MKLEVTILENGIRHAKLTGRMDLQGTNAVHEEFTLKLASGKDPVLIDLSGVDFLASLGLRTLLGTAKSVQQRGGKTVILKPTALVREVLVTAGIDKVIPIHDDFEEGCRTVG